MHDGDHWRAQGKLPLIRTDFHVGDHDWGNEDYVKFKVRCRGRYCGNTSELTRSGLFKKTHLQDTHGSR